MLGRGLMWLETTVPACAHAMSVQDQLAAWIKNSTENGVLGMPILEKIVCVIHACQVKGLPFAAQGFIARIFRTDQVCLRLPRGIQEITRVSRGIQG